MSTCDRCGGSGNRWNNAAEQITNCGACANCAASIAELRRALEFLDAVRAAPAQAAGTGAARDAWNWIEEAARKVCA